MTKKSNNQPSDSLSDKEEIFVLQYMKDRNGARAARKAGYAKHSARYTARDLLTLPHIKAAIATEQAILRQECDIDKEQLLNILTQIATADATDYIDPETLEGIEDLTNIPNSKAIQEINYFRQVNDEGNDRISTKIKLGDRLKAIDLITKILGIGEDHDEADMSIAVEITHVSKESKNNIDKLGPVDETGPAEIEVEFDELEVPDINIKISKGGKR